VTEDVLEPMQLPDLLPISSPAPATLPLDADRSGTVASGAIARLFLVVKPPKKDK